MRDRTAKYLSLTSLIFSLLFLPCLPVKAALPPAGHVILADGPFIAIQTNASARSLSRGSEFYQGDRLWTGPRTRAQIQFSDGAIMTLRPDTEFSVDEYQFDENNADNNTSFFTLIKGGFRTLTGLISKLRPDAYRVKTAYAIVGVRGTNYEVVDASALYVAVWEGTISVTNNSAEMLLGFGQDYNYAVVTSINSAPKGSVEVPPPLQQTPDPGLQQALVDPTQTRLATSVDPIIVDVQPERLSQTEIDSLDRTGFAAFTGTGTGTPLSGSANDIATETNTAGNPILFDQGADVVLRQGTAPAGPTFTDTSLAGFPVSFGMWASSTSEPSTLQPDANDGSVIQDVTSPVVWMTLFPATSPLPQTGTVSYNNLLSFSGVSSAGGIALTRIDAQLDFASGALNGNMGITDPAATWDVNFTGGLSGGQFTAAANSATSTYDDGTGAVAGVTGNLTGALTGNASGFTQAPLGMGGVFDFEFGANDVAGTFLARHDGRFFAGEQTTLAASTQVAFAAFGGTGTAPFTGQTTDGAGGSPILFDSTAGPDGTVLRQDGAPTVNVSTNTTLAGFPVSFGEWDGGASPVALLPNPDGTITPVSNSVFWMTLSPATSLAIATGAVSYNTVLDFSGSGTGGAVTALSLDGTLDFNTGALNGNMLVTNTDTWNVDFTGSLSGAQLSANADPTSTFNGTGAVTGTLTGSLTGNPSGFGAQAPLGMGGVFDFESGANDVAGTFLARHDARFFAGEVATVDRPGFAAFGGPGTTLFGGIANDGASGIPIVFDQVGDQVLRRQTPVAGDTVVANFNGFSASFGSWDGATSAAVILPDPDGFVQQSVVDPVYWITLGSPVTLPTGSVAYFAAGAALGAVGSGSGGSSITMTRFQTDVDFSTGALTNGRTVVLNGANSWDASFSGTVSGGTFAASLGGGSNVNGSAATGNLEGAFTDNGTGISGIGGVFDFEQSGTPTTNVQGAFVAREDRRFVAGELASLNQVGIAATSSPTAGAPFVGEASDGSGGSPIVFDVAANQVLRQGTAPLLGSVTTNTTLGAGFAVSWGAWNASIGNEASIQGDPNTATATQLISDPVYWVTAAATPATSLPTGTFTYGTVLGFQGSGEAGSVNALAMNINANLNLGSGSITNGTMSVQNGPRVSGFVDQWIADVGGGSFTSGQLNVNVTTGTVSVDGAAPVGGVTGNVNGVLTGPNGEGLAGGFNLQQGPTNHVDGTFLVRQ
jgi:hypothetical protein